MSTLLAASSLNENTNFMNKPRNSTDFMGPQRPLQKVLLSNQVNQLEAQRFHQYTSGSRRDQHRRPAINNLMSSSQSGALNNQDIALAFSNAPKTVQIRQQPLGHMTRSYTRAINSAGAFDLPYNLPSIGLLKRREKKMEDELDVPMPPRPSHYSQRPKKRRNNEIETLVLVDMSQDKQRMLKSLTASTGGNPFYRENNA